jgi:hypothetical protein
VLEDIAVWAWWRGEVDEMRGLYLMDIDDSRSSLDGFCDYLR